MTAAPVLESARLCLRPIGPDDAEALHPALADADRMTWWSSAPHETLEETRRYLTFEQDVEAMRSWAITLPPSESAIGWVTVIRRRPAVAELGYLLTPEASGHGYAREAVARVLDRLFAVEGCRRVYADTDPDNRPSRRLLESLGFLHEGTLRAEWETHIGVRDSAIYGLLRDEWPGAVHPA
ncbi:GNAT family N-acetyltransferase [Stakelama tenebrarum]|uniref:GNAT family N-acetyltransferase n=1 Tax=Stakelama tenebrarum TaxID=2711215 RepID=A0A6G6Y2N1_9SPHN|nr:GNAT family N-acetyltransferase [Sphingosinithalassobacter tenebrarum]QIG79101.1 GNAT family N-acetyltransferase [Sphingosinithalassobacter tenebrarum]